MSGPALRLLAFDFGHKRIGVAVGQTITRTASPLSVLPARCGRPAWDTVRRLVEDWMPDALVVGLPLNMDGTEQPLSADARRFADELRHRFGLPVHYADERLSTREARRRPGPGASQDVKNQDAVAAQIILEGWIAGARL